MEAKQLLTRREWMTVCGKSLLFSPFLSAAACSKHSSSSSVEPSAAPYPGTDEQLLDEIQRISFEFLWTEASRKTGQVKDRALTNGHDSRMMSSIAATGFGLTGLCIGDRRGYRKASDVLERVRI